jgi:hypothetical protein
MLNPENNLVIKFSNRKDDIPERKYEDEEIIKNSSKI